MAGLVLRNNYDQVQAISMAAFQSVQRTGEYQRFMRSFEEAGRLNRKLEFLPSDEELLERRVRGEALTRPEAVGADLLQQGRVEGTAHRGRIWARSLPASGGRYRFSRSGWWTSCTPRKSRAHRLHREIMATQLANDIVNRMGMSFTSSASRTATGASPADVARAYISAMEIFGMRELWEQIEALDHKVDSAMQMEMMLSVIRLIKRGTRWLLRNRRHQLAPTDCIAGFAGGLEKREPTRPCCGAGGSAVPETAQHFIDAGVDPELAQEIAAADHAYTALGIIQATGDTEAPLMDVAGCTSSWASGWNWTGSAT